MAVGGDEEGNPTVHGWYWNEHLDDILASACSGDKITAAVIQGKYDVAAVNLARKERAHHTVGNAFSAQAAGMRWQSSGVK